MSDLARIPFRRSAVISRQERETDPATMTVAGIRLASFITRANSSSGMAETAEPVGGHGLAARVSRITGGVDGGGGGSPSRCLSLLVETVAVAVVAVVACCKLSRRLHGRFLGDLAHSLSCNDGSTARWVHPSPLERGKREGGLGIHLTDLSGFPCRCKRFRVFLCWSPLSETLPLLRLVHHVLLLRAGNPPAA